MKKNLIVYVTLLVIASSSSLYLQSLRAISQRKSITYLIARPSLMLSATTIGSEENSSLGNRTALEISERKSDRDLERFKAVTAALGSAFPALAVLLTLGAFIIANQNSRFDSLATRSDKAEAETSARFDKAEADTSARFDRLEADTSARFAATSARFDRLEDLLRHYIEKSEARVDYLYERGVRMK